MLWQETQSTREDGRNVFTFYSCAMLRNLVQTHLVYNIFSRSNTIKTFYSDREQQKELKMTTVLLQSP